MKSDSTEKRDTLEERVSALSRALRTTVGGLACAFGLRCVVILFRVPTYRQLYSDLLEGIAVPASTAFFLAYHVPICSVVIVFSAIAVLSLVFWAERHWVIPFSVVVVVISIAVTEYASLVLNQPFLRVLGTLAK